MAAFVIRPKDIEAVPTGDGKAWLIDEEQWEDAAKRKGSWKA